MTMLAPAAMALVRSPEYLMPPSAMMGMLCLDAARAVCERVVADELMALERDGTRDPKSELQERLQALGGEAPTYELIETGGPPHQRWFKVAVCQRDRRLAEGSGRSKRAAERAAATEALQRTDLHAPVAAEPA